ncbi:PAS domain-containing sensor histidine kinase [Allokutzneria albata]|uniref:Sensor-like histidine kinase SenX3 n=1 Tax=Allokutzneria albata TaxID=211114 RepID=A0A1G9SGF2_ALLAB|nr:PAS domain-containing sensor histidine kinase [Allokutzneria albata]SDM34481.1 PAS domain S-box-containing protein [Allokutzneria albata]
MSEQTPGARHPGVGSPRPGAARFPDDISRLVVSASADGIIAVDEEGIIRLCNRAAEDLFGRPTGELLGTPFGFPIVADGASEVELILPGGSERVVEMRVTTMTLQGVRLRIAALRDVTRSRNAERELEEALGRQNIVVAVAAHELHNPLATISVLAHVLRDDDGTLPQEQRAEITDRIIERVDRLQALVRKLLTASRIDVAPPRSVAEPVRVLEVILEQLADIDIDQRSADVDVSCSSELEAVVDRAELAEMLANYLENALAYGRPPIGIRAIAREGWAEIRLIDYGDGVPESFVPHLFERFTRGPDTERDTEGTGLGLWITRNLAQANGGDAWYEAGEPHGSRFCLRLPLAGTAVRKEPDASA